MKVSEYIKEYTLDEPIKLRHVAIEISEFILEVIKFNWQRSKEEITDVLLMFQLWMFWRLHINGELWKSTKGSVDKTIRRKQVWNEIYLFVGLKENISGYSGNYNKVEKVVKHLHRFGIDRKAAANAYNKVVNKKRAV